MKPQAVKCRSQLTIRRCMGLRGAMYERPADGVLQRTLPCGELVRLVFRTLSESRMNSKWWADIAPKTAAFQTAAYLGAGRPDANCNKGNDRGEHAELHQRTGLARPVHARPRPEF